MNIKENILIIGGGFGGVSAAKELCKKREITNRFNIVLVSKTDYLLFTPALYEIAGNEEIEKNVSIKLKEIFKNKPVQILTQEIMRMDCNEECVLFKNGESLKYKYLVISIGSTVNDYGIRGLKRHAHFLKTLQDGLKIKNDLALILHKAVYDRRAAQIVIGGAGYTGIEISTEISRSVKEFEDENHVKDIATIDLISSSNKLLKEFSDSGEKEIEERLKSLGINIVEEKKVVTLRKGTVVLSDDSKLGYDFFVWTGGVKPKSLDTESKSDRNYFGDKVLVDENLRSVKHNNIFACGDCAQVNDEHIPMLAEVAIAQGKLAAQNIISSIDEKPLEKYVVKIQGVIVPLAKPFSYAELGGKEVKGILPYLIQQFVYFRYLLQILPFRKALSKWFTFLLFLARN